MKLLSLWCSRGCFGKRLAQETTSGLRFFFLSLVVVLVVAVLVAVLVVARVVAVVLVVVRDVVLHRQRNGSTIYVKNFPTT